MSRAASAVTIDVSKVVLQVWHAGLLHKFNSYETPGQVLNRTSSFLSYIQLQVVLNNKSSQK